MKIFLKKIKTSISNIKKQQSENFNLLTKLEYLLISTIYSYNFFRFNSKNYDYGSLKNFNSNGLFKFDIGQNLKNLERYGITEIFNLKKELCDNLLDEIIFDENLIEDKFFNDSIAAVLKKRNIKLFIDELKNNEVNFVKYYINPKKSKNLSRIINSEDLINLVKNYLKTEKIHNRNELFITLKKENLSSLDLRKSNQQYHIDLISKKFVKMFIYLSDVQEKNAPHIYLKKTHNAKPLKFSIPNYFTDQDINVHKFEEMRITGKAGTCFLEDTFGLHKAGDVKEGYRIMLAITFSKGRILWPHESDCILK